MFVVLDVHHTVSMTTISSSVNFYFLQLSLACLWGDDTKIAKSSSLLSIFLFVGSKQISVPRSLARDDCTTINITYDIAIATGKQKRLKGVGLLFIDAIFCYSEEKVSWNLTTICSWLFTKSFHDFVKARRKLVVRRRITQRYQRRDQPKFNL